jgi:hypothetical protein
MASRKSTNRAARLVPKCSGIRSLHRLACATPRHDTVRHETRETPARKREDASNGDHPVPSDACAQQLKCFWRG